MLTIQDLWQEEGKGGWLVSLRKVSSLKTGTTSKSKSTIIEWVKTTHNVTRAKRVPRYIVDLPEERGGMGMGLECDDGCRGRQG